MTTPHTPPGLPAVGNAPRFGNDPLRFFDGIQRAYGEQYPLISLDNIANQSTTIVTDAELVEEILGDRTRFGKPDFNPRLREMLTGRGLLTSEGDLWKTQRSQLQPLFTGQFLKTYSDVVSDSVTQLLKGWPEDGEVDLMEELTVLTLRVICRALFNRQVSRSRAERIYDAMDAVGREFELTALRTLRPPWLPDNPSNAYHDATEALEAFATEIIENHRDREDNSANLITTLLKAQANPDIELHDRELRDEVVTFIVAGHETTALTLLYAFDLLSQNPDEKQAVRSEATAELDGDAPSREDISKLDYTEQVVRETLRLRPAVWNIFRITNEPVELNGYELDVDEPLLLSQWAHHRDPAVWETPTEFRPERWTGRSRKTPSYFPFGYGPRVCIGRQLALTETQFALAQILQEYDIMVDSDAFGFRPAVTLQPDRSVPARVMALQNH